MTETELKIWLDEGQAARIRREGALAALRLEKPRTDALVSVYYDTPAHAGTTGQGPCPWLTRGSSCLCAKTACGLGERERLEPRCRASGRRIITAPIAKIRFCDYNS